MFSDFRVLQKKSFVQSQYAYFCYNNSNWVNYVWRHGCTVVTDIKLGIYAREMLPWSRYSTVSV